MLHTDPGYGRRLPFDFGGDVLRRLAPMLAASVRMAIEGTSAHAGTQPGWLRRAADVRLVGISEGVDRATVLHVEAPTLGAAAEEIYRQERLWDTRPSPEETAVNIFARVTGDVRQGDTDSRLYDLSLLKRFSQTKSWFEHQLVAMDVPAEAGVMQLDREVAVRAAELSANTPPPRQVRVAGKLDMIRHSTRSFELLLDDGTLIRGVLEDSEYLATLQRLLGQRIVATGKAIYRPSGSPLRIDAQEIADGAGEPSLFSKVPPPFTHRHFWARIQQGGQQKNWMDSFFGKWPGDETDEELQAMLRELRG
ncbi:MAG TPA: hypothetical protein VIC54_09315 [Terriglobales bacterium]